MSADYQDTIANYLARKENFSYALEVVSAIVGAKKVLRRSFWEELVRMLREHIQSEQSNLTVAIHMMKNDAQEFWYIYASPKVPQKFSLNYCWENDNGVIRFGLYYSIQRLFNDNDQFKKAGDLEALSNKLADHLTVYEPTNEWALRWSTPLGSPYEEADLRRIAENPAAYAAAVFELFKSVFTDFHPEIAMMNQTLAALEAPVEIGK